VDSTIREPLDDGALAADLDTLGTALDGPPQRDGNFFHQSEPRRHHLFYDRHDQRVTFATDVGRPIDEAIHAAASDLDALAPERRIHDDGSPLYARAHADDAGASNARADAQPLGGERDADALRFAYVQSLGRAP
jgi:hypothetical protein